MAVNPDPKPGRWILPLVVLGMVAFTYFFVRELPEASPDTTLLGSGETTTTTTILSTGTTLPGDGNGTSTLDPETQAYIDGIGEINAELQILKTEMITVNAGFDADPREIEFGDAVTAFEQIIADTQALSDTLAGLTPPEALQINHDFLVNAMGLAVSSAQESLAGLRSSDTGELRQASAEAFTNAADDFDTEVTNANNAANGA